MLRGRWLWRRALSSVDEPRMLLVTQCGKCQAPIRKSFSKVAYEKVLCGTPPD